MDVGIVTYNALYLILTAGNVMFVIAYSCSITQIYKYKACGSK